MKIGCLILLQILSSDITNAPTIDVTSLQTALTEKQSDLSQISQTGISTILCDPDADSSGTINLQVAHQVIESMICSSVDPPLEDTFQPPHVHVAPPLHRPDKGKVCVPLVMVQCYAYAPVFIDHLMVTAVKK